MTLEEAKKLFVQDKEFHGHITTAIDFCYSLYWDESMPKDKLTCLAAGILGKEIAEYIINFIIEGKTSFLWA